MASKTAAGTFSPCLFYRDAPALIDWLERAFGFRRRLVVPGENGTVTHAELSFGDDGVVMVSSAKPERGWVSPRDLAGLNQVISVSVDDPDAHCARARAAGAEILQDLKDEDYGSRGYLARDPEGNQWYFGTYRPGGHWTQ
jgi:uncharacterized glyoxalase superfamily protein PhnB